METALDESLRLLRLYKEGDGGALNELLRRYEGRILAAVRARLGGRLRGRVESGDVVQEVLRRALPSLANFEPRTEGALMHFFSTLVANQIRDLADYHGAEKRAVSRETPLDASEDDGSEGGVKGERLAGSDRTPSAEVQSAWERDLVESCLDLLPEGQREVVIMRQFEGLEFSEIGEQLDRSADAARMLCNRALARLTALVAERGSGTGHA